MFGNCFNEEQEIPDLRRFQDNLLKLQTITEVDGAGTLLYTCSEHNPCPQGQQCPDKAPKLVRAKEITHVSGPELQSPNLFMPTLVIFEELESVQDIDSWSDTTIFNLLHFFRNFTTHRLLINCPTKTGYLNLETREFKAEGEEGVGDACPWQKAAKGSWILVPEVSDVKHKDRDAPPRFHLHPLLRVCSQILLGWHINTNPQSLLHRLWMAGLRFKE